MPLTVVLLLALSAFIMTVVHAMGRCPLWPAVLVLCIIVLLMVMPMGGHGLMLGR